MIRRSLKWIIPALLFMCVAMNAHKAQAQDVFINGNDLVKWMEAYERDNTEKEHPDFFLTGEFTGFVNGVYSVTSSQYLSFVGMPMGLACDVVSKFLKENPERWSEPAFVLVVDALKKTFPKK